MFLIVGFVITAGFVFPFPVFVLSICQVVGRTFYSIGYSSAAGLRIPGFILSAVTMTVMEVMVLFVGLRSLGLFPYV